MRMSANKHNSSGAASFDLNLLNKSSTPSSARHNTLRMRPIK